MKKVTLWKITALSLFLMILLVGGIGIYNHRNSPMTTINGLSISEENFNDIQQLYSDNKFNRGMICSIEEKKCIPYDG